jgi:serine/threonine protein kinase
MTNEELAIKVILLESIKGDVPRGLLNNELQALKQLNHTNIIKTYDICQTANNIYIVSEFCN